MMTLILFTFLILPTVRTILLDIRYPQFFHVSPNDSAVEITEGKTAGSFIAFLTIINGTFDEWSLNCSDDDFQVIFNGISYSLITRQTLDRERREFYQLIITGRHLVYPFETLSRTIRLRILDLNDSPPRFNQTSYRTILVPNQTTFTIRAFDADQIETENSRISYSLANYHELFRINETTGTIECVKIPSSTSDRYEVIVEARDHGKPSLSSSALVQIQLHRPITAKSLISSRSSLSMPWFFIEQRPENMLIVTGILIGSFFLIGLFTCLICSIHYKLKRRDSLIPKSRHSTTPAIHFYLPENLNNSTNNEILLPSCDSSDQSSNQYLLLNSPPASYV